MSDFLVWPEWSSCMVSGLLPSQCLCLMLLNWFNGLFLPMALRNRQLYPHLFWDWIQHVCFHLVGLGHQSWCCAGDPIAFWKVYEISADKQVVNSWWIWWKASWGVGWVKWENEKLLVLNMKLYFLSLVLNLNYPKYLFTGLRGWALFLQFVCKTGRFT